MTNSSHTIQHQANATASAHHAGCAAGNASNAGSNGCFKGVRG